MLNTSNTRLFWRSILLIGFVLFVSPLAQADTDSMFESICKQQPAILVIGASFSDGRTPINDNMLSPSGGGSVNFGSYLALGAALIRTRTRSLPGFVINEAQAGATTFDRLSCNPVFGCIGWQGYDKQFDKALARVTVRNPLNLAEVLCYNAKYVVLTIANDCLHSGAFMIPQEETQPCALDELNAYLDRLIAIGERALELGITPIYDKYPAYSEMNLPLTQQVYGMNWILDKEGYNALRDLHRARIAAELPDALVVDMWRKFTPISDGLHPNSKTSMRAASRIGTAINKRIRDLIF
jgi:hypothetical protein